LDGLPFLKACAYGHLDVVKWLYEAGTGEKICNKNSTGWTPLWYASRNNRKSTVLWLILQGAANDESGHVEAKILVQDTSRDDFRKSLLNNLTSLLDQHSTFTRLVLPATCTAQAASAKTTSTPRYALRSKKASAPLEHSPLALLCGHEETLLAHIADFVGVVRGRQLRNAREATSAMLSAVDGCGDEADEDEGEVELIIHA
jgi:hypothetical protein